MNTFGERFRLTTFGESHGTAIGGVIDGFPAGIKIDFELIERRMKERRPGGNFASPRKEEDMPQFLSGINTDGISLGSPIGFIIANSDIRPEDYDRTARFFRPNHADYTYQMKYGIRDPRGGGRASARETACRVVAGVLGEQYLDQRGVTVEAWLSSVGRVEGDNGILLKEIERVRKKGDSVGGVVKGRISGLPAGIGEPVYNKLSARLAFAMMSINAVKGFEIGDGFKLASNLGSEVIDEFYCLADGKILTHTNHSGGIQGGISNAMPVTFSVAFKPTPTIGQPIPMLSQEGEVTVLSPGGRHDPCVALRGVAVVRAMACLVAADFLL